MSKSPMSNRRKVFLTQDESVMPEGNVSKISNEIFNPKQELSSLKKKYDTVKQENIKKTQYLHWLQGKVFEIKSTASSIEADMKLFQEKSEMFENELANANLVLQQELELKRIYEHMLSRNKSEGTQLDIKVNKFSENFKLSRLKLENENEKARKAKDQKFSVKSMLKDLKANLNIDTKKRIERISNLESSILQRRELIQRYDTRAKRQAEIVEIAAKHDREAHEKSVRESIIASKLLYELLIEKEKAHRAAGQEIEMAFQDIKTRTGITDPREILNRFMNQNNIHNRLIESVENAESTFSDLKIEYNQLRNQLKDLVLLCDENEGELEENEEKTADAYKMLEKTREQKIKTSHVYADVKKWCKKICEKFEIPNSTGFTEGFNNIAIKIDELVEKAKIEKESFKENLSKFELKKIKEFVDDIYLNTQSISKTPLG